MLVLEKTATPQAIVFREAQQTGAIEPKWICNSAPSAIITKNSAEKGENIYLTFSLR
jgi:hypothetical protein